MLWRIEEVTETLRMVENENLDIRTVTMGISLLDTSTDSIEKTCDKIYKKITTKAKNLVSTVKELEEEFGIPIVNKRIAVTPISLIGGTSTKENHYIKIAQTMDNSAKILGVDYIGGFSALVHKGNTINDDLLIEAIPYVLSTTKRVCSSVNVASTKSGINMDAVRQMGYTIKEIAEKTKHEGAIGCAKFVVFANVPEDNPFIAGAFHGIGEPECVINIGVSGPGVVLSAIKRLMNTERDIDFGKLSETIKRMAFKITRAGELIGREVSRRLGVSFGIVDLSLAPTPAVGDSVANILEAMGLEKTGTHGTTAALALLTDAVKKGGIMASSYVGGLSGSFIPVSEDRGMIEAVEAQALSLEKLEAMTSVCSVGLDMIAIPGDTSPETISAIIADEVAIGVMNNKTTAVRIIPVPGKSVGEKVVYGGLLGEAPIMKVSKFSCKQFINLGGRIPAPIISLKN